MEYSLVQLKNVCSAKWVGMGPQMTEYYMFMNSQHLVAVCNKLQYQRVSVT